MFSLQYTDTSMFHVANGEWACGLSFCAIGTALLVVLISVFELGGFGMRDETKKKKMVAWQEGARFNDQ
eukprot:1161449-Pelagomonas_calceolata.AAC.2